MSRFVVLALVVASCVASLARAQERVAAYESLDVPRANQQITFVKQISKPGDRIDQQLEFELQLESTVRQGDQEVDKSTTHMVRRQSRTVIAETVDAGRTTAARVRFAKCDRKIDDQVTEEPVVGKTYRCSRLQDDRLSVTRDDGALASPDEFAIVSESMQSLGRPNPLADFLAGKTVDVGDVLELPLEVGAALLGADDSLGEVSKFELTLREVDGQAGVATFAVEMESLGSKKSQMRLMVTGELDVEIHSCRTQRLELTGPLGMATTTGSYSAARTSFVRGKLRVTMNAEYN